MNDQLRIDVWEGMVDSDRLERYYGRRAAKLARWEAVLTGATCAFAVVSAILLTVLGSTWWAGVTMVATALVSIVPLLSRLGDRVLSAARPSRRPDGTPPVGPPPGRAQPPGWPPRETRPPPPPPPRLTGAADFFAERGAGADIEAARRILRREGGQPPAPEGRLDDGEEEG